MNALAFGARIRYTLQADDMGLPLRTALQRAGPAPQACFRIGRFSLTVVLHISTPPQNRSGALESRGVEGWIVRYLKRALEPMEPLKNIAHHTPLDRTTSAGQGAVANGRPAPRFWRGWLARWLAVLALIAGIVMITSGWWLSAIGHWLARPPQVAPVDAIVVLGGRYPYRDQHAIDLYHQGIGQEIWRTGPVELPAGRLVQRARQLAREQGIPEEAYFVLESYSTWDDGQQIAALARERQTRSVLIVTDWAHSRRALCVIGQHLAGREVTVLYDHPRDLAIHPDNWWRDRYGREAVLSELGKMGLYALQYGTLPFGC